MHSDSPHSSELPLKTTDYYAPSDERCILWSDPHLAIEWPLRKPPILSTKDRQGAALADALRGGGAGGR